MISQCGKLSPATPKSDILYSYSPGSVDEIIDPDADTIFGNLYSAICPITCSLFDAGDCGGRFSASADLTLSPSAPWTITASKSNLNGFSHGVCFRCTNDFQIEDLDNWK
jgi:hypothetical protein